MKRLWWVLVLAACAGGPGYQPAVVADGPWSVEFAPRQESGFVVVEVTARNDWDRVVVLDLEDVVVLDGDGLVMRRLDPGEAADMRLARVDGAPTYPRKWAVRVAPGGDGLVVEEAPASGFAEGFAQAFADSGRRYMVSKADELYREGLRMETRVPPGAGVRGWAYFLGRDAAEVRFGGHRVAVR